MKRFLHGFAFCLVTCFVFFIYSTAGYAESSMLKEGMSGDGVLKLQEKLSALGYYQDAPDGSFGPGTRSAVASFQAANNLNVDGIAGASTIEALSLIGLSGGGSSTLQEGMSGDNVLKLQQKLHELGYYQGTPDGSFGPATRSAVANFQAANKLAVDGIAGLGTLKALLQAGPSSNGQSAIKEGMSGDNVLELQQKLRDLGYYQGTPDGYFGPGTASAVTNFQHDNKLTADGIAGTNTLEALLQKSPVVNSGNTNASGVPSALKEGMSGDSVLKLQTKLIELGYYQGAPDGNFGPGTRSAVTNFQYDNKLTVDGVAGERTLLALQSANPQVALANRGQAKRDAQAIVAFAKKYLGVPYVWAGQGPSGFDCSGFTYYVFKHFNISLPRIADGQYSAGSKVSNLQPGDLVFFTTYEPGPSHVGIYIGDNRFIHASSGAGEVTITSLSESYYKARYLGARRVIG